MTIVCKIEVLIINRESLAVYILSIVVDCKCVFNNPFTPVRATETYRFYSV